MNEKPIFMDEYKIDFISAQKRDRIRYLIIFLTMVLCIADLFGCSECENQRDSIEEFYEHKEKLQEKGRDFRGRWVRDTWICMNPKCRKRNYEEQSICSGCRRSR